VEFWYGTFQVTRAGSDGRRNTGLKVYSPPAGAKVVDASGKYLIPGLWDMHVHAVFAERLDSMFPTFVANGVLGIRDMGTAMPLADIDRLRQQTANGSGLDLALLPRGQSSMDARSSCVLIFLRSLPLKRVVTPCADSRPAALI
jgi:hypothetical protein